jgi:hypothetical protein
MGGKSLETIRGMGFGWRIFCPCSISDFMGSYDFVQNECVNSGYSLELAESTTTSELQKRLGGRESWQSVFCESWGEYCHLSDPFAGWFNGGIRFG